MSFRIAELRDDTTDEVLHYEIQCHSQQWFSKWYLVAAFPDRGSAEWAWKEMFPSDPVKIRVIYDTVT